MVSRVQQKVHVKYHSLICKLSLSCKTIIKSMCHCVIALVCFPQICPLQWPRHVWHPCQRSSGHNKTSIRKNCHPQNTHRSLLLSSGATLSVDNIQLNHFRGYWKFLQPQSASWAQAGWKYDITVSLGISKGNAQVEDTGPTQQQTH